MVPRQSPDTLTHSCNAHIWIDRSVCGGVGEEFDKSQWEEGKSGPDRQVNSENCGVKKKDVRLGEQR